MITLMIVRLILMQTYIIINVFNGISCVFPNDEFDLSYVGANGKPNEPLFENIRV